MDVIFIEPYDGGSHRAFREGLTRHSRHRICSLTLPGRFWKWRMRGASAWFADALNDSSASADLLLVTGFLNVADLRGLLRPPLDRVPILLYMHENQLTYPLSPEEEFDFHFGFTNIISCLAADLVVFNSAWHREVFLEAVPRFLGKMPEATPRDVVRRIGDRSEVAAVGLARQPLPPDHYARYRGGACAPDIGPRWPRHGRHLVLWNHRWEFDKRPDRFAAAVTRLIGEGHDFDVALVGEPRGQDAVFADLRERLGDRCVAFGHEKDRDAYDGLLARSDIVVSCAEQEYFGISVAEAVHAGCYPVLPRSQVYPSFYGVRCRGRHLYEDQAQLEGLLRELVSSDRCGHVCSLDLDVDAWCWARLAPKLDDLIESCAVADRPERGDRGGVA